MRLAITGGSGLLGTNFALNRGTADSLFICHNRLQKRAQRYSVTVDLTCRKSLALKLQEEKISHLIHAAALTNVDFCESNLEGAYRVNYKIPKIVSDVCEELGIKLVFLSTDQVFDGKKNDYTENDNVNPINVYGETKAKAEEYVLKTASSLIVRTNFFSWGTTYRKSLTDWMIQELRNSNELSLFSDVFFSPLYAPELIEIIMHLLKTDQSGVFHLSSDEVISKCKFGSLVADIFELDRALINPVKVDKSGLLARRPKQMGLNNKKMKGVYSRPLFTMKERIERLLYEEMPIKGEILK